MTDLVRYTPPQTSMEIAGQAWKLAEKIANTEAVPTALRNRPEAVLAIMLVGHEAGISPMQSLAKIHIIEGRPGMSAELMRALVLQHGHELTYEELTTDRVTAAGRRKGTEKWTRITWTMEDAGKAGLRDRKPWKNYPRAMLTARATGELCRLIFPDVLAGISYTMEELSDGTLFDSDAVSAEIVASAPAATKGRRTAQAKGGDITRPAQPADDPAPAPESRGAVPPLPGEEDIVDADIVEPVTHDEPAHTPPAAADPEDDWPTGDWPSGDFPIDPQSPQGKRYTGPQLIAMRLGDRFGIKGNSAAARQERLDAIAVFLRPVASSKELTPDEVSTIITMIDAIPEGATLAEVAAELRGTSEEDPAPPPATEEPTAAPESAPSPDPAPPASAATPPAAPTPPRRATPPPEEWTGDAWRDLLAARKVKVGETVAEAQRLARDVDPAPRIVTLEDVAGSGIAGALLGFVEDLSLERRAK